MRRPPHRGPRRGQEPRARALTGFVLRRLFGGLAVVVATAVFAYGGWRALRHDLPENAGPWLAGTWSDLVRTLWHRDYGVACAFASPQGSGCKSITGLFDRGWQADLWMLAGALGVGTAGGVWAGSWCAANPGSLRGRTLEIVAMVGLCAPPFAVGYGLLLLFEPSFGRFGLPLLFDVNAYRPPYVNPWDFLRALAVPWLVAGAPIFGVVLRLTRSAVVEASREEFMVTTVAKGLSTRTAVRRHGRPAALPTVFAWIGTSSALIVTNVLITESVFAVPGFLVHTRRALKPPYQPELPDHVLLQALAVWGAVLIVGLSILSDLLVAARDPRVRASGRLG